VCGLSGVIAFKNDGTSDEFVIETWERLFKSSTRRGTDASGVFSLSDRELRVLKTQGSGQEILKHRNYPHIKSGIRSRRPSVIIGHSRLATNGSPTLEENNQPIVLNDICLVHNGIVVNDSILRSKFSLTLKSSLDTESIIHLLNNFSVRTNPKFALARLFAEIKGNATLAFTINSRRSCILATNNGSLYYSIDPRRRLFVFASEPSFILDAFSIQENRKFKLPPIKRLEPNSMLEVPLEHDSTHELVPFTFDEGFLAVANNEPSDSSEASITNSLPAVLDLSIPNIPIFELLVRCKECILPSTFPGLDLDKNGICRYCREKTQVFKSLLGEERLLLDLKNAAKGLEDGPILVGVSGGRDSCYGLHYLKKELSLDVVAYTYDWGMVTDLARRNIARVCGELNIEHIIVAPNLSKKMRNVNLNLRAWLQKPDLGMLPLLMAGDKQFFKYAHRLKRERNFGSVVLCAGNFLETTEFKARFANVEPSGSRGVLRDTSSIESLALLRYYIWQVIRNPAYLNKSILDSVDAFISSYFMRDDYVYLYNYIEWNEDKILEVLRSSYDWEHAMDTSATWRIGDGTAAFYNYVYYSAAGFTESDTFRSNQIRAGVLSRNEALELTKLENAPRLESLMWYLSRVGINIEECLRVVHAMTKLWNDGENLQHYLDQSTSSSLNTSHKS
jgi:glucosamine--fructose-6-phosphate aminotransferase (isomerizing)